ncbi:50S ribosome-binding protein YggL [Caballeronia sp. GAWG1-1]|uniref:YggL 50S ribosome-binding family protein n=1 Tax=Caballeronia sp. GAWG1-1 TaxID=2921742 RepID=UPI002028E990|nr:50S ribosome-binding protein YggL [Caballeronia sp. GAWG1-1]
MAKNYNRRQRKKLHLGEFQELVFRARAQLVQALDAEQIDILIDTFLEECVEANGMLVCGGINEDGLAFCVQSERLRGSATDSQREIMRQWLEGRPEFIDIEISALMDGWYGYPDD